MLKSCNMKKRGMVKCALIFLVMSCVFFSVNRLLMSVEAVDQTLKTDILVFLKVGEKVTFACPTPVPEKVAILTYGTDGKASDSTKEVMLKSGEFICTQEISNNAATALTDSQKVNPADSKPYAYMTMLFQCEAKKEARVLCVKGEAGSTTPTPASDAFGFSFPNSFLLSVTMLFSVASFAIFF